MFPQKQDGAFHPQDFLLSTLIDCRTFLKLKSTKIGKIGKIKSVKVGVLVVKITVFKTENTNIK